MNPCQNTKRLRTPPIGNGTAAVRRFLADRRGSVAIMFALTGTLLTAVAGGTIDFGRWQSVQSRTQATVDAAVLAAGRAMQLARMSEEEVIAVAQTYFDRNKPDQIRSEDVAFSVVEGRMVVGRVNARLPTTFLNVIGMRSLDVSLTAKALTAIGAGAGGNLEFSLMLDVTGSMCDDGQGPCSGGRKLDALKRAASELVNIVVWDDQSRYTSKVAIVPFSTRIRVAPDNAGASIMRSLTDLPATWSGWYRQCVDGSGGGGSEGGGQWTCHRYEVRNVNDWRIMPCVTDRTGPQEFTDDAPGPQRWLNAHDGTRRMLSLDHSNTPLTTQTGRRRNDPAEHWNYQPMEWGGGVCADIANVNSVLPLTSDKRELLAKIAGLEAYGSTAGALGTAWAWYMISPRWSSIWPSQSRPGSYSDLRTPGENGAPRLRKIAVLMSDGEFNTWRGWKDQDQQMVSDKAVQLCTNMKAEGIAIYTVGFALDELDPHRRAIAEATMRACGTNVHHFYNALNVEQLEQAFRDIALQATKLRLVN